MRPNAQLNDAIEGEYETHEEADGLTEVVGATEATEPNLDGFMHTCIRLPRGHDAVLAHAEIVLWGHTLSQFGAHHDEVFLAS